MTRTRLSVKRKSEFLVSNRLEKRARIISMKNLAKKICRQDHLEESNNVFQNLYNEQKLICPWLSKESLRWHIRSHKKTLGRSDVPSVNTSTNAREPNSKVSTLHRYFATLNWKIVFSFGGGCKALFEPYILEAKGPQSFCIQIYLSTIIILF